MNVLSLPAHSDGGRTSGENGCTVAYKKTLNSGHWDTKTAKIHGSQHGTYLQRFIQAWMRSMSVVIGANKKSKSTLCIPCSMLQLL